MKFSIRGCGRHRRCCRYCLLNRGHLCLLPQRWLFSDCIHVSYNFCLCVCVCACVLCFNATIRRTHCAFIFQSRWWQKTWSVLQSCWMRRHYSCSFLFFFAMYVKWGFVFVAFLVMVLDSILRNCDILMFCLLLCFRYISDATHMLGSRYEWIINMFVKCDKILQKEDTHEERERERERSSHTAKGIEYLPPCHKLT